MFRVVVSGVKRGYSTSVRRLAEAAAPIASTNVVINFNTPHAPVYANKQVQSIVLPGEDGEYGVTAGHAPLISQLKPGVVAITHAGGETERFFVSGGFAITNTTTTDVSVPEAFPLSDFDEAAVKSGYAEATRAAGAAPEGAARAAAQVEAETFANLARALNINL